MTSEVSFIIPGKPVGKESVRFNPASKGGYIPPKSRGYISRVQMHAMLAMRGKEMFDGPVAVLIDIRVSMPKSWSIKRRSLMNETETASGPDVDNVQKSILDGMTNYAYKNDKQVSNVHVRKLFGRDNFVTVCVRSANCESTWRPLVRQIWDLLLPGARGQEPIPLDH